ncbi:MAG: MotA/TolQ/ExbB proton channel family protein [Leptospiraceae bacterium]
MHNYLSSLLREKKIILILAVAMGSMLFVQLEQSNPLQAQPAPQVEGEEPASEESGPEQETPASEPTADESQTDAEGGGFLLWDYFQAGGSFMWVLFIAGVIGLAVFFERIYFFTTRKLSNRTFEQDLVDALNTKGMDGAKDILAANEKLTISKILNEGLAVSEGDPEHFSKGVEREAGGYLALAERGLPILAAVSTIAPLIGFLGTVAGMVEAFDAIANADSVNAKVVAGGIKVALLTTAGGLIVAIPAMTFFQFFQSKVNAFATEVEQAANHLYKELLKKSGKAAA